MRSIALPLLVGLLAGAGLIGQMVALNGETRLEELRWPRRYWEDTCAATKRYLDASAPGGIEAVHATGPAQGTERWRPCRDSFVQRAHNRGIGPLTFWRTIPARALLRTRTLFVDVRPLEDQGRATALAYSYRLLGGAAPFLLLWLGVLAALPVFIWVLWEFFRAGYGLAGTLLLLLSVASPFLVGTLSLPHSGVGFYMLALLGSAGLAAFAVGHADVTPRGLLIRAGAAGLLLGLCAACRSTTLLLAPGYLLALWLGTRRLTPPRSSPQPHGSRPACHRLGLSLAVVLAFCTPPAALVKHHPRPFWLGIWEGLGDFDVERGHVFNDSQAAHALAAAGIERRPDALFGWFDETGEAYFRRTVLNHVRSDPGWYLGILGRRLFATVTQQQLWPHHATSADGRSMAPNRHANQGDQYKYYRLTFTADWLGLAPDAWLVEVPVALLLAPSLALVLLAAVVVRWPRLSHGRPTVFDSLLLLACPAVAAVTVPVLVTTAAALETETFVVVLYLGAGLLAQEAVALAGTGLGRIGPIARGVE